jgi:hypothetical protein
LEDSIYELQLMNVHLLHSGIGGGVDRFLRFQPGLTGRAGYTGATMAAAVVMAA